MNSAKEIASKHKRESQLKITSLRVLAKVMNFLKKPLYRASTKMKVDYVEGSFADFETIKEEKVTRRQEDGEMVERLKETYKL
ncbi:MAG: hypothetical protein WC595_02740 [Candidatus Nanoarchaeia archaeon]